MPRVLWLSAVATTTRPWHTLGVGVGGRTHTRPETRWALASPAHLFGGSPEPVRVDVQFANYSVKGRARPALLCATFPALYEAPITSSFLSSLV